MEQDLQQAAQEPPEALVRWVGGLGEQWYHVQEEGLPRKVLWLDRDPVLANISRGPITVLLVPCLDSLAECMLLVK